MNVHATDRWHPPLHFSFLLQLFFLPYQQLLFSSFFLISNGFLSTLTSTSIVLSALASYRKTNTVTDTTVATNIHQTLDIQLNFRTKITFYFILSSNDLTNLTCLIISPVFYFQVSVNTCFVQNLC